MTWPCLPWMFYWYIQKKYRADERTGGISLILKTLGYKKSTICHAGGRAAKHPRMDIGDTHKEVARKLLETLGENLETILITGLGGCNDVSSVDMCFRNVTMTRQEVLENMIYNTKELLLTRVSDTDPVDQALEFANSIFDKLSRMDVEFDQNDQSHIAVVALGGYMVLARKTDLGNRAAPYVNMYVEEVTARIAQRLRKANEQVEDSPGMLARLFQVDNLKNFNPFSRGDEQGNAEVMPDEESPASTGSTAPKPPEPIRAIRRTSESSEDPAQNSTEPDRNDDNEPVDLSIEDDEADRVDEGDSDQASGDNIVNINDGRIASLIMFLRTRGVKKSQFRELARQFDDLNGGQQPTKQQLVDAFDSVDIPRDELDPVLDGTNFLSNYKQYMRAMAPYLDSGSKRRWRWDQENSLWVAPDPVTEEETVESEVESVDERREVPTSSDDDLDDIMNASLRPSTVAVVTRRTAEELKKLDSVNRIFQRLPRSYENLLSRYDTFKETDIGYERMVDWREKVSDSSSSQHAAVADSLKSSAEGGVSPGQLVGDWGKALGSSIQKLEMIALVIAARGRTTYPDYPVEAARAALRRYDAGDEETKSFIDRMANDSQMDVVKETLKATQG